MLSNVKQACADNTLPNANQTCVIHTLNVKQVYANHAPNVSQARIMHTQPVTEQARPHKTARTIGFINLPRLTIAKITVIMGKETAGEAWGGFKMRKGDEARHTLLCRAAELFDARGYDAVSIKDIADSLELGVSFGGGDIDEEVVLEEKDAGAVGGAGDDGPDCTGGGD